MSSPTLFSRRFTSPRMLNWLGRTARRLACSFACLAALQSASGAAAPSITNVSLRGLRIGGVTTLVVDGAELGPQTKLILPWPNAQQSVRAESNSQRAIIDVTLPPAVQPGLYSLRLASDAGVSNLVVVGVDQFEQKPWSPEAGPLPTALHGALAGEQRLRTTFAGRKGQAIAVDVECQRLGSAPRPVVRLIDARGVQLAWSPPRAEVGGDARLDAVLPQDGVYTVEVHDLVYRAAAPGFVRVKIGELSWANQVFSTGVTRNSASKVEWRGSRLTPAGAATLQIVDPLTRDAVVPFAAAHLFTGHLPSVAVSDSAEVTESATSASPGPAGRVPLAISGRLSAKGEEDRFLVEVTPGRRLQFEVYARRIGSPVDAVLSLVGPQGNGLASADDRPGTPDPLLDFAVPANMDRLQISVRDLSGRGGDDFVYRVVARDLSQPEVEVVLPFDRLNVAAGSTQLIPVQVLRRSYDGPVQLEFRDASIPGLVWQGLTIAPGAAQGLVSLTVPAGAAPTTVVGRFAVQGGDGATPLVRAAQAADGPAFRLRPWARSEFAIGTAVASPLSIDWVADGGDETLPLGWKLVRKVAVQRSPAATGAVRLRLVTTQPTPKKTVKQNNQDVQVDDVERTLRLEGTPQIAAGQSETQVAFLAPAELGVGPWSLAIVAELLAADGKTVVAAVATPVKTMAVRAQLTLQVANPGALEGRAGMGEAGKLTGQVMRATGWDAPVTVSLAGLPEGVKSPEVVVPAGQVDFVLPLQFAAGTKAGDVPGVRVVATGVFAPQQPEGLVRSNEVPVKLKVLPGT